jgi:hypothetical protein
MTRVQRFLAPVGESELPPHGPMVPCLRALLQRNRGPTVLIMHSSTLFLALAGVGSTRLHTGPGIQNSQSSSATVSRSSRREQAPSSWRNGTVPSCPAIAEPRSHKLIVHSPTLLLALGIVLCAFHTVPPSLEAEQPTFDMQAPAQSLPKGMDNQCFRLQKLFKTSNASCLYKQKHPTPLSSPGLSQAVWLPGSSEPCRLAASSPPHYWTLCYRESY